jgi:hypothetical protein
VLVCLVSGTGSAVREVEGVFSVFFIYGLSLVEASNKLACRISRGPTPSQQFFLRCVRQYLVLPEFSIQDS